MAKAKIGLIFGGPSNEHEVSLASAANIRAILLGAEFEVIEIGISKHGEWFKGPEVIEGLIGEANLELIPSSMQIPTVLTKLPPSCHVGEALQGIDLAFPVTHGDFGEDGTLQGLLEALGIKYIGCGQKSSILCYSKELTKIVLKNEDIPVLPSYVQKNIPDERRALELINSLKFKSSPALFVKPCASGSSLGISRASSVSELQTAVKKALQYSKEALIEPAIDHAEYVFGVVKINDEIFVSCGGECIPTRELYDYKDKYIVGNPYMQCPAILEINLEKRMKFLAARCFEVLGCRDFARVDFFLQANSQDIYVNEINTIPGFTGSSVFSKVMNASGLTLEKLFSNIIKLRIREST